MSVINASEFRNRATKVIDIPGFDGDTIQVRIKATSVMGMLVNGKLPNELMGVVSGLFTSTRSESELEQDLMNDSETMKALSQMMNKVCEEALVEPLYCEIADYITDEQKQAIFEACVGGVKKAIPSV